MRSIMAEVSYPLRTTFIYLRNVRRQTDACMWLGSAFIGEISHRMEVYKLTNGHGTESRALPVTFQAQAYP